MGVNGIGTPPEVVEDIIVNGQRLKGKIVDGEKRQLYHLNDIIVVIVRPNIVITVYPSRKDS